MFNISDIIYLSDNFLEKARDQYESICKDSSVFFIPNIIGYIRILLIFVGVWERRSSEVHKISDSTLSFLCFSASALLDIVDGWLARQLNQVSLLGAALDMIADRITNMMIVAALPDDNKGWIPTLLTFISLDIASHFMAREVALLDNGRSHKDVDDGVQILKLYYENRIFMGALCVGDFLFHALFLYPSYNTLIFYTHIVCGILWACRVFIVLLQLAAAIADSIRS